MDFLQSRLLGEVNTISDTYVAEGWSTILCGTKNSNQIEGKISLIRLPEGRTVTVWLL